MQMRSSDENAVRLSVKGVFPHTKDHFSFSLVFWEEEWLVEIELFYVKFLVNRPPLERNSRFSTDIRS